MNLKAEENYRNIKKAVVKVLCVKLKVWLLEGENTKEIDKIWSVLSKIDMLERKLRADMEKLSKYIKAKTKIISNLSGESHRKKMKKEALTAPSVAYLNYYF